MEKWGQGEKQERREEEPDAATWVRQRDGLAGNSRKSGLSGQIRGTLGFGQPSDGTFPNLTSSTGTDRSPGLNTSLGGPQG